MVRITSSNLVGPTPVNRIRDPPAKGSGGRLLCWGTPALDRRVRGGRPRVFPRPFRCLGSGRVPDTFGPARPHSSWALEVGHGPGGEAAASAPARRAGAAGREPVQPGHDPGV